MKRENWVRFVGLLMLSFALLAQEPKPKPADASGAASMTTTGGARPPAPTLSDTLRAKFWRKALEARAANEQAKTANAEFDAVQAEARAACEQQQATVVMDKTGEPSCQLKPESVKPEPAKPAAKK